MAKPKKLTRLQELEEQARINEALLKRAIYVRKNFEAMQSTVSGQIRTLQEKLTLLESELEKAPIEIEKRRELHVTLKARIKAIRTPATSRPGRSPKKRETITDKVLRLSRELAELDLYLESEGIDPEA